MLQIISGKFFKSENRHVFDGKGITYSNYAWFNPVQTCVATIEPVRVHTYYLYHMFIVQDGQLPNYESFLDKYIYLSEECCVETLLGYALVGHEFPWKAEECARHYRQHQNQMFSKNALRVPRLIDLCVRVHIANTYLREGQIEEYSEWLKLACLEASGKPEIQESLEKALTNKAEVDIDVILPLS